MRRLMKTKDISKKLIILFLLCVCAVFVNCNDVSAAKVRTRVFDGYEDGEIKKCGKYYLKWQDGKVYISSEKNGVYEPTPITYNVCATEKKAYYIDSMGKTLCEYSFAEKASRKVKKMCSSNKSLFLSITAVYGNNVYVTCGGEETWRNDTYIYNIKKKKVIKKIKSCDLVCFNGSYVISSPDYRTDVSGSPLELYKMTSRGLKKVKKLCNYGFSCAKVGNKFYYTDYPDRYSDIDGYKMNKVIVYKCNANGFGKKQVATISSKEEYAQVLIQKFTDNYLEYWDGSGTYRYTYKTKKTTKIQ